MTDVSSFTVLRRQQVEELTGLSKAAIYSYMRQNLFPRPIKLGPNRVGWIQSAIVAWIESRQEVAA